MRIFARGSDDITRQPAKHALESFDFVVPLHGRYIHCNQINAKLQLQVDVFCRHVSEGVQAWEEQVLRALTSKHEFQNF